MERTPQPSGVEPERWTEVATDQASPVPDEHESRDERVIHEGIRAAAAEDRPIDHRTARYIAGQLHGGQDSGLYALASTGAIADRVLGELVNERAVQTSAVQQWIDVLIAYCASRPDAGPIADWLEQSEAEDQADLMTQIAAGSVAVLGDIAVVHTPESNESAEDEPDSFSWGDAAHWSPKHADAAEVSQLTDDQLEALLAAGPDEEIGEIDELGWHALIRSNDRPGGYVVVQHSNGEHEVTQHRADDVLNEAWAAVVRTYEAYYDERTAYENATGEADDGHRGVGPQIWVGSLADYNAGYLYGDWFDATRDANELELATRFMLRSSRMPNAEEWSVMDYDGFGPLRLGEYVSFDTISRIANGIAEHGEAFAAWAAHVGPESHDALDRFEDQYRGEWESFEAYVEDYLRESGFYRFLDDVPEDMRGYIEVDVEQIARDWRGDYDVIEQPGSGVWVFDSTL